MYDYRARTRLSSSILTGWAGTILVVSVIAGSGVLYLTMILPPGNGQIEMSLTMPAGVFSETFPSLFGGRVSLGGFSYRKLF